MGPVQGPQQLGTRAGAEQGRADAVFAQVSRIKGSTGDKDDTNQPQGLPFLNKFGTAPMVLTSFSRIFASDTLLWDQQRRTEGAKRSRALETARLKP